ncbi:MAG: sulfite exporter TauE/SafE family protein, partial [Candidatus Omnitrophota bacterium]
FVLGFFIIALGAVTCFGVKGFFGNTCAIVNKGHVRNVGLAGFLVGLSPCLPLLGMLNYVVLVSKSPFEAMMYILVFGLGTICSPLVLLIALSGKFAQVLSQNQKIKIFLQYACGAILMFLGARIMMLGVR